MHDVAPATWSRCQDLLGALREVAPFPATLLVVPHYHHGVRAIDDQGFCDALDRCLESGDELVLHGLFHHDEEPVHGAFDRIKRHVYTASEGEFATLSLHHARERIAEGLLLFEERGWPVSGFVAPAWLASGGTWQALAAGRFDYTTTLGALHLVKEKRKLAAQSLVYSARSSWRRVISAVVVEAVALHLRNAPLVRFGLHPVDAEHKRVVRHWQSMLMRFSQTHAAITKKDFVERLGRSGQDMAGLVPSVELGIASRLRSQASLG